MFSIALVLAVQLLPEALAGPHAVGFRVLAARDASRRRDGADRPIQIALWYPARSPPSAAGRLRFGDYVGLADAERSLSPSPEGATRARDAWTRFLSGNQLPVAALESWLAAPMLARRDVPTAGGRFPLVVIAQGNGQAAADQAVLAEMLASHGFVVLTTPSPLRLGARMESEDDVLPVAREQARDLAFAVVQAQALGFVAPAIAWVGHSFGARAALLAGLAEPRTTGLVSLDGGIGAATAKDWLAGNHTVDATGARFPLLHFYEDVAAFMTPDFDLFESMRASSRRLVLLAGMPHHHFTSFGWAAAALPELNPAGSSPEGRNQTLGLETLRFLNGPLGGKNAIPADADAGRAIVWSPDTVTRRAIRGPASRLRIDDGGAGEGVPVVFVHGNGGSLGHWSEALQHLRARRRAVAFDLRGNGESRPVREPRYGVDELAGDIQAVADALALGRFVLVAHSSGSSIAVAYAAAHPGRVAGLYLVDPASDLTKAPSAGLERYLALLESPDFRRVSQAAMAQSLRGAAEGTTARVLDALAAAEPAAFIGCLRGLGGFDLVDALGRYRGPAHVLLQAQRENDATGVHKLVPELPHSTLDGVSHFLMLDKPRELAERLDGFLSRLDATGAPR